MCKAPFEDLNLNPCPPHSHKHLYLWSNYCINDVRLWSTNVARRLPHRSSIRGAVFDAVARASVPRLSFFFFFSQIHTDSSWFMPTRLQFAPIRLELGHIGRIRSYRLTIEMAEIGLESCWNSRNRLWMRPKHPKSIFSQFYSKYLLLILCFLFCFVFLAFFFLCFVNQGIVMYFLRIF